MTDVPRQAKVDDVAGQSALEIPSAQTSDNRFSEEYPPLYAELSRIDALFSLHLENLRLRGRSILGDPIGGAVIEEGEAEGLLIALYHEHTQANCQSESNSPETSPLATLDKACQLYQLLPTERDLLLLALAVEIDSRYARLVAFLNDHVAMTRPTLGLALSVLLPGNIDAQQFIMDRLLNNGPLTRFNLLEFDGDEPLANRCLKVPAAFWPRLIDMNSAPPFSLRAIVAGQLAQLALPDSTRQQARCASAWAQSKSRHEILVVVQGPVESGRETLAHAIAAAICDNTILIDSCEFTAQSNPGIAIDAREYRTALASIEREALWSNASVIVADAEQLSDRVLAMLLTTLTVPLFFLTLPGKSARIMNERYRDILEVEIPERYQADRVELWQNLLETMPDTPVTLAPGSVSNLAARYGFGPNRISNALGLASNEAAAQSTGQQLTEKHLESACQRLRETRFGDRAQKLDCPFVEEDLVLAPKTRRELDMIKAWVKYGEQLFAASGPGENLHTGGGLACLFSGPPGTGKTMAAQVIARSIGYDIYRIDLSQVVNKYIGETEKNLSNVFDEAQRSNVILFFDEADALFGKRSDVKDAQDRYANLEVGYLLQRLEIHKGLTILATNLQKNLDEAFLRRLQITAEFPVPEAPERLAIWQRMLARENKTTQANFDIPEQDLATLSNRLEVAGGEIRNALFSAHLFAADDGGVLKMRHLVLGVWRELQKSGRIIDIAQFGPWQEDIERYFGQ